MRPVNIFAVVDPATDSMRRDTDFSVIIVIAVDGNNSIYVIDYIRNRSLPVLAIPGYNKKGIVFELFDSGSSHTLRSGRSAGLLAMPLDWDNHPLQNN